MALTKFLVSAHDLTVENGRFINIPNAERSCSCNINTVENEYHVTCLSKICKSKKIVFESILFPSAINNKKLLLLSSNLPKVIISLSKFIHFILINRTNND